MNNDDGKSGKPAAANADIISFPHSRVTPKSSADGYKTLGMGRMAETLGAAKEQQSGHWCSRCKGIWFGFLLEVECPKCGNRQG